MNNNTQNWGIVGHENIVQYLDLLIKNKNFAHFYIFSGPSNTGKSLVMEKFISKIIEREDLTMKDMKTKCIDFYFLEKLEDKKNISIEQVRNLIYKLQMTSFNNSYKIAVIKDAENLNQSSSNALLKLLEEPSKRTIIFLLTNNSEQLIETIKSRSVNIKFNIVDEDKIYQYLKKNNVNLNINEIRLITRVSLGKPGLAITYLQNPEKFAKIKTLINLIVDSLDKPICEKFLMVKDLSEKEEGIELLNLILRDILLLEYNLPELLVNVFTLEKLTLIKDKIEKNSIVKMLSELSEYENAKAYNVNKLLFLENIILNI